MNAHATLAATLALGAALSAFAAPDEEVLGKSKGYPVCPNAKGSFSPESCLIGVMSHYHVVYPSRVVKKSDSPRPLQRAAQEPVRLAQLGDRSHFIAFFLMHVG